MTPHESYVRERFDALEARFKVSLASDDFRWQAARRAMVSCATRPRSLEGLVIVDLGCGKGRFGRLFRQEGARVVGIDPASAMLGGALGLEQVQATARRLPIRSGCVDGVVAIEVFEHLDAIGGVLDEVNRVLRPGGVLAVIDKNVLSLSAQRPWLPATAVKWRDERRGRWMYPPAAPARERWFRPESLSKRLAERFERVEVEYLLSPEEEAHAVFRRLPRTRLFTLWTARKAGGDDA